MTDYEKGNTLLAIAAAAETVQAVASPARFTYADQLDAAYTRESILARRSGSGEQSVHDMAWRFRVEGQWGY